MEKHEYVDRIAIREKVCTGCTMWVDGVCRDADPCEKLIAGFLEAPSVDVVPANRKEKASNDPMTLDELRKMDGEPVWVEHYQGGEWIVVHWNIYGRITTAYNAELRYDEYGERWTAYRQKPEEGDHDSD